MNIKIYQPNDKCEFCFKGFRFVEKFYNGNVNFDTNYKKVYEFEEDYEGDMNSLLEGLFIRFQGIKPRRPDRKSVV